MPESRFSVNARPREKPARSRIATSPTSCGISCVATASAVVMPSGIDVSTAAAITAPSTNVWNASPTITSDAALLVCTSHSCVSWQCRQSTSFSSRKNASTPASSVPSARAAAAALERLRQQREQRDAEQRADRVADRPRHDLDAESVAEQQERRGREQAAEAAEHAQANGDRVKLHDALYRARQWSVIQ